MKKENFKDIQSCTKIFIYGIILFKTLSQICLTQSHYEVKYRMASNLDFIKVNIRNYERVIRNPNQSNNNIIDLPNPVGQRKKFKISKEKKKHLKSMLKWIPPIEQQFLKNICE
jgi:hypothetical protein